MDLYRPNVRRSPGPFGNMRETRFRIGFGGLLRGYRGTEKRTENNRQECRGKPRRLSENGKGTEWTMLKPGDLAPAFTLPDSQGNQVSLTDFKGKKVVVYFYPKDSTPGCARQACAFRDSFPEFEARGVVVIGISKDSAASHLKFAQRQELPFLLLSDENRQAIEAYGVWQEKKLYGKASMGVVRTTFLVDEAGRIEAVFEKAKPDTNAGEILNYLDKGERG